MASPAGEAASAVGAEANAPDPLAVPLRALQRKSFGGAGTNRRLGDPGAQNSDRAANAASGPSLAHWAARLRRLAAGQWRRIDEQAATPSAEAAFALRDANGQALGRVTFFEAHIEWQPAGDDGAGWRADVPSMALQQLRSDLDSLASGAGADAAAGAGAEVLPITRP